TAAATSAADGGGPEQPLCAAHQRATAASISSAVGGRPGSPGTGAERTTSAWAQAPTASSLARASPPSAHAATTREARSCRDCSATSRWATTSGSSRAWSSTSPVIWVSHTPSATARTPSTTIATTWARPGGRRSSSRCRPRTSRADIRARGLMGRTVIIVLRVQDLGAGRDGYAALGQLGLQDEHVGHGGQELVL